MAMPVGSMVAKFRDEFEAYIEEARQRNAQLPDELLETPIQVLQGAH
jgi:hypothetical protein